MTNLVIAEHDAQSIKAATLNTIAAAQKIGGDIHVLVAGHNAQAAADAAAKIAGVSKVLLADAPQLEAGLAENVEATVLNIAKNYSHILAPAAAYGKNIAPRIAAKLDVAQISDITAVDAPDTFEQRFNLKTRSRSSRSARPASMQWQPKAATQRSRRSKRQQTAAFLNS
jgi:electron transfer flavoprotein alpha subunit